MLWLCVAVRVLANPLANVLQKLLTQRGAAPLLVVGAAYGLLTLLCLPLFVFEPPPPTAEFWVNVTICTVLAAVGNVLLVKALRMSDLSILGPVNSWKAVVSLIPGMVLLHEMPGLAELAGVALILAGSYFIVDSGAAKPGRSVLLQFCTDRGIQYRLAALVLSAVEAVFLKRALLASSPAATFAVWSALAFLFILLMALLLPNQNPGINPRPQGKVLRTLGRGAGTYLLLAIMTGLMQFTTIVIFAGLQVAPALALFQTSTLVSVALGWRVFREQHILKRLAGSTIMLAGAVLIVIAR